jgi:excinuclease ABC subunit C
MMSAPDVRTPMTEAGLAFDGKAYARTLARGPGVYRMLDAERTVLYVGKAANLNKRVASYFTRPQLEARIMLMVARVAAIEVTLTRTEGEALVLENELIKSLKPRYNVLLRDDKSFPYIYLSSADEFPRMAFHRGARNAPGRYFGPFPSAWAVRESLALMQKLFRVRQCEDSFFRNRSRPCLQHQIGRCTAPCVRLIAPADYARDVRHAAMFLEGRSTVVIEEMVADMDRAAVELAFERAAKLRDQIASLKQVQAQQLVAGAERDADVLAAAVDGALGCVHALHFRNGVSLGGRSHFPRLPAGAMPAELLGAFVSQYYAERPAPGTLLLSHPIEDTALIESVLSERAGRKVQLRVAQRGERRRLVEVAERNARQALASERLDRSTLDARWQALARLLGGAEFERIECYDISHTMGEATVGSSVVFDREGPVKSQYRRYNVEGVAAGDDYAAMRQVLGRRLKRAGEGGAALPDLLFIDGGKGQVAMAFEALDALAIDSVMVVGVAKGADRRAGLEQLVIGREARVLKPAADDPGLHLVQQIRDEAHRFAISGHRGRRQKRRERSVLQDIEGVGPARRALLLKHFGGLAGILGAGVEELMQVRGIDRALAERIYAALHE